MTSITGELREYTETFSDMGQEDYEKVLAIADRIDVWLTEQFIALPLDVDGIAIHVGDELVDIGDTSHRGKVRSIELRPDGNWIVIVGGLGRWSNTYRHVKKDSWEGIIYDAMQAGRTEETIDVTPLIDRCKALVDIKVKALEDKITELSFHEDMGR